MNIALYFGSYNPIHKGHLAIALALAARDNVDKVWFVVSPSSPFKSEQILASEHHRIEMVREAIDFLAISEKVEASDVEFSMERPSYTINTLKKLKELYPCHTFSLVMGGDNIVAINKWREGDYILKNYQIFVYPRDGYNKVELPNVKYIENLPLYDISSTTIRGAESLSEVDSILEVTKEYIIKNGIYGFK